MRSVGIKRGLKRGYLAFMILVVVLSSNTRRSLKAGTDEGVPAAVGDLDPTFGTGGKVVTDFGGEFDRATTVGVQPDGKIVAGGFTLSSNNFALARYNVDGGLDSSFGSGGKVTTDFDVSSNSGIAAIAIQADGKVIAAGGVQPRSDISPTLPNFKFAMTRYNPDGSLDQSFGSGGKVVTDFTGSSESVSALVIQPDRKILAAGFVDNPARTNRDFALARYNPDGSLDSSFGFGGKVITDFGGVFDGANAIAIQPGARILVAGSNHSLSTVSSFSLVRYNVDGSIDSSFGSGGKVTTRFSDNAGVRALALQPDSKIVAAGTADDGKAGSDFALARYNPDGSLDLSFGCQGKVTTDFGTYNAAYAMSIQSDGKIVVAGGVQQGTDSRSSDFVLARYNPDGGLDSSFGSGGKVITDFSGGSDTAFALTIQPDHNIVLAGQGETNTNFDFALARYVTERDFALSIDPAIVNATRPTKVRLSVRIHRFGGFSGAVVIIPPETSSLNIKMVPDSFSTPGEKAVFKLKIRENAPSGPQMLVFTAKDDTGRVHTATVTLVIEGER